MKTRDIISNSVLNFIHINIAGIAMIIAATYFFGGIAQVTGTQTGLMSAFMLGLISIVFTIAILVAIVKDMPWWYSLTIPYLYFWTSGILFHLDTFSKSLPLISTDILLTAPVPALLAGILGLWLGKYLFPLLPIKF